MLEGGDLLGEGCAAVGESGGGIGVFAAAAEAGEHVARRPPLGLRRPPLAVRRPRRLDALHPQLREPAAALRAHLREPPPQRLGIAARRDGDLRQPGKLEAQRRRRLPLPRVSGAEPHRLPLAGLFSRASTASGARLAALAAARTTIASRDLAPLAALLAAAAGATIPAPPAALPRSDEP
jgi:hypothetical protein